EVDITATDVSPQILGLAGAQVEGSTRIRLQQADARALPFANQAFDVVTCSLALHHFSPADAVLVLRQMDRVCRTGFIVNDLRRGAVGYGASWFASRLTTRNRLTRHDAPLSIRRAYTPEELRSLLDEAGVQNAEVQTLPWFRMVAIKRAARD
ncbi:MAG TPA: methyltransferase domain-containing protein, partial [Reyranella sp.]|nr:methyltransferase domain-containing protein [Reyranella sp.]